MNVIRVIIGVLVAAIVAVAAVPLLVLADLVGGGDGWGLCSGSLDGCETSYFDGPELLAGLLLIIFLLLMLLRITFHARRVLERHREDNLIEQSVRRRDSFRGR